jgi:hypothetical protein
MSRLTALAIVTTTLFLCAASFATTGPKPYAVGTCEPTLQSFTTISQAVSSVPAGSTILVCPGNYPEQVLINQPLTLQGVNIGGSGAAVVTVPSSGLVQSVTDQFTNTVYYQVLVQNPTGPVNITNLGVDGTGNAISGFLAGIFYQDASGAITSVNARNQATTGAGSGILVHSFTSAQTVTVQNTAVNGFDGGGIAMYTDQNAPMLTATIKTNNVHGNPFSAGIFLQGVASTVQSNAIDAPVGLVMNHSAATVTANTISGNNPFGSGLLTIRGGSNTVKSNKIDAGGHLGVQLSEAGSNVLQSNTITNSSTAVYGCNNSVSGNTVTGNTITGATVGISMPIGNVLTPNKFFVVGTLVVPCT